MIGQIKHVVKYTEGDPDHIKHILKQSFSLVNANAKCMCIGLVNTSHIMYIWYMICQFEQFAKLTDG